MKPLSDTSDQNQQLVALIHDEIERAGGFISFARFMEISLYTPNIGYYSSSAVKFGREGDFITAPEISPLFAKCMANQFSAILDKLGGGDILEVGAGSGVFAKDVLLTLEALNSLPANYFILEISPALRAQQKQLFSTCCPHLLPRIKWLESFPSPVTGIIFANEVMDALPVHLFRMEDQQIFERGVTFKGAHLAWQLRTPSIELLTEIQKIGLDSADYESEIHLSLTSWLNNLASSLKQGVILLADYGYGRREYYHSDRNRGTLMCFHQHQKSPNPFTWVGLQDITSHIDFTRVIETAVEKGLNLAGYTTQAAFLLASGLTGFSHDLSSVDNVKQNQAIKRLTMPTEMGEIIKVMALSRNFSSPLFGFSLYERRHDL